MSAWTVSASRGTRTSSQRWLPRDDAGRPVLLREVRECPECGAAGIAFAGVGEGIEKVVSVKGLHRLAGSDRGDGVGIELVVVAEGQQGDVHCLLHVRMQNERRKRFTLGEEGMQPLGVVSGEVPVSGGLALHVGAQIGEHPVNHLMLDDVFQNDAAVALQVMADLLVAGARVQAGNLMLAHGDTSRKRAFGRGFGRRVGAGL